MSRYIDREALLEWIEAVDGCLADGTVEAPTLYAQMITDIKQFPTADVVEVRHGEWTTLKRGRRLYCSRCEYPKPYKKLKTGHHIIDEGKFCPNCGAKMDGERKD